MDLDQRQRQHVSILLKDGANILLASFVVGQFAEKAIQWQLVLLGSAFYFSLAVISTNLQKGE